MRTRARKAYPSDAADAEWAFAAPYLALVREDAPQRTHALRDAFDALRYVLRTGCQWRYLPGDFPPWPAVYQQARRWADAGVFEAMAHDLRVVRLAAGRVPTAELRHRAASTSADCAILACRQSLGLQGRPQAAWTY